MKLIVFEKKDGVTSFKLFPLDELRNVFPDERNKCWMLVSDDGSRVLAEGGDLGIIRPGVALGYTSKYDLDFVSSVLAKRHGVEFEKSLVDHLKLFMSPLRWAFLFEGPVQPKRVTPAYPEPASPVRTGEDVKPKSIEVKTQPGIDMSKWQYIWHIDGNNHNLVKSFSPAIPGEFIYTRWVSALEQAHLLSSGYIYVGNELPADLKPAQADEPLDWEVRGKDGTLQARVYTRECAAVLWGPNVTIKHVPQR